jgi:hypothetical protein
MEDADDDDVEGDLYFIEISIWIGFMTPVAFAGDVERDEETGDETAVISFGGG